MGRHTASCTTAAGMMLAALVIGAPVAGTSSAAQATNNVDVEVDAASVLATLPEAGIGVNTAVWDAHLLDAAVPALLKQAGVTALRFPGGSTADTYHWQHNVVTGGYADPRNTFDAFVTLARKIGAQPIITVNYGSNAARNGGGDPAEASAWVRHANVTKRYGVKYWEVGNEIYGNGTYNGVNWETDLHGSKGPAAYATNYLEFARAMKAVDPNIKVGAALVAPNAWPDGQSPDWNSTVLAAACSNIDFAIVHWYAQDPGSESDAGLLESTSKIAGMVSGLRHTIKQHCGSHAGQVQIMVTETNSVSSKPGKQTTSLVNALFLADNLPRWLEQGAANVDWWDLHNSPETGNNNGSSLYGSNDYGDYGLLSSGGSTNARREPAANTPLPAYYGLRMLAYLGSAGDHFVRAASSEAKIAVHAVKQAHGNLALLLINKDPSTSYTTTVSIAGYRALGSATVYSYGMGSRAIRVTPASGYGARFTQTLRPYSLTTIVLHSGTQP